MQQEEKGHFSSTFPRIRLVLLKRSEQRTVKIGHRVTVRETVMRTSESRSAFSHDCRVVSLVPLFVTARDVSSKINESSIHCQF